MGDNIMADAVTTKVLVSTKKRYVAQFTNLSDGTGESAVQKVDVSALEGATSSTTVSIEYIKATVYGMYVKVLFDHTTDDIATIIDSTTASKDFRESPIPDPASAGETGDILFTTVGHTSGDFYDIVLSLLIN